MKAYSLDVRDKVLRAVDQGYPREEIIKLLGVSRATIKRYLKQRRELIQDEPLTADERKLAEEILRSQIG